MAKIVIGKERTAKNWPWYIPVLKDNGGVEKVRAGLDLKLPGKKEYRKFLTSLPADYPEDSMPAEELLIARDDALTDYIISHVTGWHGFASPEDEKKDAEFSEGALRQVLDQPNAAGTFHQSFNAAMEGRKVKN